MNPFYEFAKVAAELRGHAEPTPADYLIGLGGLLLGVVGVQLMFMALSKDT